MVFKNLCVFVLSTKVASALEGLSKGVWSILTAPLPVVAVRNWAPGTHCPPGGNVKLLTTSHPRILLAEAIYTFIQSTRTQRFLKTI